MMTNEVISKAALFAKKHNFSFKEYTFTKNQLWGEVDENEHQNWLQFNKKPGVYIITNDDKVIYIGKSINNAGKRLFDSFQDDKKMELTNDSTRFVILSFDEDKHLTSSLESYLIEKFNPLKNDKIG